MDTMALQAPRAIKVGSAVARARGLLARQGLSRPRIVADPFMVASGLIARLSGGHHAAAVVRGLFSDTAPAWQHKEVALYGQMFA